MKDQEQSPKAALEAIRRDRQAMEEAFENDRKLLQEIRKDSLRSSQGKRGKALNSLKSAADAEKTKLKEEFQRVKSLLDKERDDAVKAANATFKEKLGEAESERKKGYLEINDKLARESAPIIERHKAETEKIEEDYRTAVADVDEKEALALSKTDAEVAKLKELGKRV